MNDRSNQIEHDGSATVKLQESCDARLPLPLFRIRRYSICANSLHPFPPALPSIHLFLFGSMCFVHSSIVVTGWMPPVWVGANGSKNSSMD